jgi:glucose-6-phosphate 1-dehydrogenase
MKDKNAFKPCDLVIYGALGDLSKRKLIISLYRLENANFLEPDTRIIGVDLHDIESTKFVEIAYKSLEEFLSDKIDAVVWKRFSARLSYLKIDLTKPEQ